MDKLIQKKIYCKKMIDGKLVIVREGSGEYDECSCCNESKKILFEIEGLAGNRIDKSCAECFENCYNLYVDGLSGWNEFLKKIEERMYPYGFGNPFSPRIENPFLQEKFKELAENLKKIGVEKNG